MHPSQSLVVANRTKPLGFKLGQQVAWIDNDWKVGKKFGKGQCKKMLPPYNKDATGPFLFNLVTDPTESHDLSKAQPTRFAAMVAAMDAWEASIEVSAVNESQCEQSGHSPPGPPGPSPAPGPPMPPTPPSGGFSLKNSGAGGVVRCLTLTTAGTSGKYDGILGPCDGGSKWEEDLEGGDEALTNLALNKGNDFLKLDGE